MLLSQKHPAEASSGCQKHPAEPAFAIFVGLYKEILGINNFVQNFITDSYMGKQETEIDVDALVRGIELNTLLSVDCI